MTEGSIALFLARGRGGDPFPLFRRQVDEAAQLFERLVPARTPSPLTPTATSAKDPTNARPQESPEASTSTTHDRTIRSVCIHCGSSCPAKDARDDDNL
jgi:hypothetical protein